MRWNVRFSIRTHQVSPHSYGPHTRALYSCTRCARGQRTRDTLRVEGGSMSFADEFDERGREARVDEAALARVLQAEDPLAERLRRYEAWAQYAARQVHRLQT